MTAARVPPPEDGTTPGPAFVRACGAQLKNSMLWQAFHKHYHQRICTYVLRALRQQHYTTDNIGTVIEELVQEVYVRLLHDRAHALRCFVGNTDYEVLALFATIAQSVVKDYRRHQGAAKRNEAGMLPFDVAPAPQEKGTPSVAAAMVLAWIDIERLIRAESDSRHGARNIMIFRLHYQSGLTAAEIAAHPGIQLTDNGVETVLRRITQRLHQEAKA